MKKILVINGSPKEKSSNTFKHTQSFLKGLNKNKEYEIEIIYCSQVNVNDCKGCFYCWRNEEENRYQSTFRLSAEIKDIFETPFLPIQDFLSFVEASFVLKTADMTEGDYLLEKVRSYFKSMSLTYDATKLDVDSSVLEVQIIDYSYVCQLHINKKSCTLVENRNDFINQKIYCANAKWQYMCCRV